MLAISVNRICVASMGSVVSRNLGEAQQLPHAAGNGYELPNGWRLTPLGRSDVPSRPKIWF